MIRINSDERNRELSDPQKQFFSIEWGDDLMSEQGRDRSQYKNLCGTDAYWFLVGYLSRNNDRDIQITLEHAAEIMNNAVDDGVVQYVCRVTRR